MSSNLEDGVSSSDRLRIVREMYRAYETGDRNLLDPHLSDDFRFYSPADVGIDLTRYFERCWPNAEMIAKIEFERMIEVGNEVIVTYEIARTDGNRFRNTEILTFDGDRIRAAEVYFGWDLEASEENDR
ncbi:MAG: nuclear transport factor 2 family protein [Actinomycetota bacterium]|nr:nuclear transport factor 2 family protein [Actinomycetota bacterium]